MREACRLADLTAEVSRRIADVTLAGDTESAAPGEAACFAQGKIMRSPILLFAGILALAAACGGKFVGSPDVGAGDGGADSSGSGGSGGSSGGSGGSTSGGSSGGSSGSTSGGSSGSSGGSSGSSSGSVLGDGGLDATMPAPNAKIYLVHAATDPKAPPIRFCVGLGPNTTGGAVTVAGGIDPFPDFPAAGAAVAGLPPGSGAWASAFKQISSFDLSTLTISFYAIDATQIAGDTSTGGPDGGAELPCEALIGTDALGNGGTGHGTLTLDKQFWMLGTVPKGTFAHGETWVLAVTGCFPGLTPDQAASCLASPPYSNANGNLSLNAWALDDKTAAPADGLGVQLVHASPAWDRANATAGGVTTASGFFTGGPGAGSTLFPIAGKESFGSISPPTLASAPIPLNSAGAGLYASFVGADGGAIQSPSSPLLDSLPVIDALTNGATLNTTTGTVTSPAGGSYAFGHGYAFILVGDPTNPAYINPADGGAATSTTGTLNGKAAHFLGIPTSNP